MVLPELLHFICQGITALHINFAVSVIDDEKPCYTLEKTTHLVSGEHKLHDPSQVEIQRGVPPPIDEQGLVAAREEGGPQGPPTVSNDGAENQTNHHSHSHQPQAWTTEADLSQPPGIEPAFSPPDKSHPGLDLPSPAQMSRQEFKLNLDGWSNGGFTPAPRVAGSHSLFLHPSCSTHFFGGPDLPFATSTPFIAASKYRPGSSLYTSSSSTSTVPSQYSDDDDYDDVRGSRNRSRVFRPDKLKFADSKPTICPFFSNPFLENADLTRALWRKRLENAERRSTPSRASELKHKSSFLRAMDYIEDIQWDIPSEFDQYLFLMRLQAKEQENARLASAGKGRREQEDSDERSYAGRARDYDTRPYEDRNREYERRWARPDNDSDTDSDKTDSSYTYHVVDNRESKDYDLDYALFKQVVTVEAPARKGRRVRVFA